MTPLAPNRLMTLKLVALSMLVAVEIVASSYREDDDGEGRGENEQESYESRQVKQDASRFARVPAVYVHAISL